MSSHLPYAIIEKPASYLRVLASLARNQSLKSLAARSERLLTCDMGKFACHAVRCLESSFSDVAPARWTPSYKKGFERILFLEVGDYCCRLIYRSLQGGGRLRTLVTFNPPKASPRSVEKHCERSNDARHAAVPRLRYTLERCRASSVVILNPRVWGLMFQKRDGC